MLGLPENVNSYAGWKEQVILTLHRTEEIHFFFIVIGSDDRSQKIMNLNTLAICILLIEV